MDRILTEAGALYHRYTAPLHALELWLLAGAIAVPVRLLIQWLDPRHHALADIAIELVLYGIVALPFIVIPVLGQRAADRRYRRTRDALVDVVEQSGDVIFTLDFDGRYTWVNAAAERVLGRAPAALLGTPFMAHTAPDHVAEERMAFARMLRGEEYVAFETKHVGPDGREIALSVSARVRRDEQGALIGVQGIAHDISQRAAAMQALLEAHEAAAEAARAKAAFMATVSHEIRTPMHGVLGTVRLLLDQDLGPEQRRLAAIVRESGESLLEVIDQVLDFSKLEAGRVELEDVVFALPEAVESVVRLFGAQAAERGVALWCDIGCGVPSLVSGDPARLRQVLGNLVGNALKFTPRGGTVEVLVAAETPPGGLPHVRFRVRDTGIGIAPDRLGRIFEAFEQADRSTGRRYGGSGLGLAIARQIVSAMAGELTVVSSPGEGSTFTFAVPLRHVPGEKAYAPARRTPAADLVSAAGMAGTVPRSAARVARRVLVVDANEVNRLIAVSMLRARGHEVEAAASGREAVAAALAGPYDLILMDVEMPDVDGLAATRALRDDGVAVPIVAVTSHAFAEERARCLETGMHDVLTKPYTPEALDAVVERWAAEGGAHRAPASPADPAGRPAEADAGVDVAGLRATLREAGIASLFDDLVGGFTRDAPRRMATIEAAVRDGDGEALARAAHAYKGSAGAVAARGLAQALGRLEAAGRAGDADAARERLAEVRARHRQAMGQLRAVNDPPEGAASWSDRAAVAVSG